MTQFLESSTIALCAAVFFSRILDVTLGTLRMVNVVRGNSALAMGIGFCETFIWFIFAREALQSASGIVVGVAYAAGYASGTLIGTLISKRVTRGKVELQVITSHHDVAMLNQIRAAGYGVTALDIHVTAGGEPRFMLLISLDSRRQRAFMELLRQLDENAFVTVMEEKAAYNGYFSPPPRR